MSTSVDPLFFGMVKPAPRDPPVRRIEGVTTGVDRPTIEHGPSARTYRCAVVDEEHWQNWHKDYDDPVAPLSCRLAVVRGRISDALDGARPGRIRVISMCAGDGRDLLGVLSDHPRSPDVSARLIELDPMLAARARDAAAGRVLTQVEVVQADAASTSSYLGAVPADMLLVCGVFGNISDDDVHRTIDELPRLAAADAVVVWTRHPRPPDRTPTIRRWFVEAGFDEVGFDLGIGSSFAVGTNHFHGAPLPIRPDQKLFRFTRGNPNGEP